MRKFLKVFFISFSSLLAVILVTISVVLFLVFTPERLTPIVRKQAVKFITCKSEIGEVELTFFSTFPDFGIKIKQFALINPVPESQSDTLVRVDELVANIDAAVWWKKDELILTGLKLSGGSVNLFTDSLGHTNYDIFATDTATVPITDTETTLPVVDIRNIELNDVSLSYYDLSLKLKTVIRDLSANISGTMTPDNIRGEIKVSKSVISLESGGEKYLQQASVQFDMPVDFIPSRQFIGLREATASVNDLEFWLNGSIENDTINRNLITDLKFRFTEWPVKNLLSLVPPSFGSYFKGLEADGLLSSEGSIKGLLNDSVMPMLEIRMFLEKGIMKYSGFPLPLHDIKGDISIHTDLKSDSVSFVKINEFNANTPLSSFSVEGIVIHLFKDIYCNLTTTARLSLEEFNQIIPDSLKLIMKGRASGKIRSAFSMTQMVKMQLEKMKLSGSISLSDFDLHYDSISLKTDHSKIDFSLPNNKASSKETGFAFATIVAGNATAVKPESYNATIQNAFLSFETSDLRDSTRIPDFICFFKMDSLSADIDTMSIAVSKPHGKFAISPIPGKPDQPRIIMSYKGNGLKSIFGHSSFALNKIDLETDILNDNTQKDIFLQWIASGFIEMEQATLNMAGFSHPVEIPSVKMNFEPEAFNIREGRIKINKSDFQLTGALNNIVSYFRGDSLLRGNFNFVSNTTDVSELMALTNGIGYDTTAAQKIDKQNIDTTLTGPYMVPKRIDILLNANIKKATMGVDTATNISGKIQVHDGVLVLDGLSFDTPAARMQLTAIYRTPRKNHLFLGLDYQMHNIEISELLTMIPDIDTIMPMLRSFSGKGEFHIAVETYLDSLYNIKKSTLRGASSISGNDLVLMDGETFSEIAKTLRFSKKTQNKVDTLSAEFTIFKNEIDVYPFLIIMDKYKAVIAGRHNLDMTFNYHISVVDCPLPFKLGVDIKGNETDLSYKLAPCKYAAYYRPSSRHAVENKRLELSKLIRETLTQKVIE